MTKLNSAYEQRLETFWNEFEAAGATSLDKDFEAKRNADFKMSGLTIEPKLRPKEPIKNDDSPCQRTINRLKAIQARWKMTKLQLAGESTEQERLTDAERCERFNSRQAVASNKLTRLEYILTR